MRMRCRAAGYFSAGPKTQNPSGMPAAVAIPLFSSIFARKNTITRPPGAVSEWPRRAGRLRPATPFQERTAG
jgi:hypothetical protein